jgi:hypothetical protein
LESRDSYCSNLNLARQLTSDSVTAVDGEIVPKSKDNQDDIEKDMAEALERGYGPKISRFALALLSGAPYIGGAFSGAAGAWSQAKQDHFKQGSRQLAPASER